MTSPGAPNFLVLFAIMALSQTIVADSGEDFSNNLFSDLAPILALFGEQVAKQFMSQSMGWSDNIIFAMAPLGIITAIVGAIRVGGPGWLKAIIGRARENKAAAEVELMSSTSHDVCELWNGQAIVRMMGKPPILELIYIPELAEKRGPSFGLFTLSRPGKGVFERDKKKPSFIEKLECRIRPKNAEDIGRDVTTKNDKNGDRSRAHRRLSKSQGSSPNIYHNLTLPAKRTELHIVAFIGVVLQLGALVFSGLTTYYTQWELKKGGRTAIGYAYPFMAVGTALLVAGMLVCSFVIEQSTVENTWRIGKSARIMWLQQGQEVNDQLFRWLIKDTDANKVIKIRKRLGSLSGWSGIASSPAISVAMAIEAVMNILFTSSKCDKELVTWTMGVRVGVGSPQSICFDIKRDENGKWKADATEIEAALSLWLYSTWQEESPGGKRAHGEELGDWLRDGNLALRKENIRHLGPNRAGTRRDLRWYIGGQLSMILEVQDLSNAESGRHDVAAEIISVDKHRVVGFQDREASESWNSALREVRLERRVLPAVDSTLRGSRNSNNSTPEADPVLRGSHDSTNSAPVWPNSMLAVAPGTQIVQLLAQDMFSTFMWAVAQKTDQIDGETNIHSDGVKNLNNAMGWQHFRLENSKLAAMAEGFQRSGLGNLEEAYLSIIPQLSTLQKLPAALPMIDYACCIAQYSEAMGRWKEASEVFLQLFQVGQTFDKFDPVAAKTIAVLYELHEAVDSVRELWNSQSRDSESVQEMNDLKLTLLEQLGTEKAKPIVEALDDMCIIQRRKRIKNESSEALKKTAETALTELVSSDHPDLTDLHVAVINNSEEEVIDLLKGREYLDSKDLLGWTPLHYSVAVGNERIVEALLIPEFGWRANPNSKDLNALTPLHYAARNGQDWIVLTLLDEGGELEAQGRDGMRPLHYAVK
ncbi:hypothetical protein GP486_006648 [Trichoglossum hirsutum]|uniref:Ankyrin repeat protein n=1 Tax=Trichoglossum hirsutum TaxID=265104 RepID=A0A9P8L3H8_9PEZI|nr:hypothetical protein GP486_006648 [Trichoglossum hirsutum]